VPVPRKPRLLVLITLAEPGGAQTSVSLLLPGLADRFEVTLAAHGSGPLREAARAVGVPFVQLEHLRRPIHPWHDALGLAELVRLCRRLRPDIVHAHSSKAGVLGRVAAMLAGVPIRVFTVHGWPFGAYGGLQGRLFLWLERLMRPITTSVICVADSTRELGLKERACDPERTLVIHNAVDTSGFARSRGRRDPPRIISIGRLAFPKDFATLVEALRRVEAEHEAVLVGDGPDLHDVTAEIRRRGLSTQIGLVGARRDVGDLLAEADVFVLSSRSEGFPISILEAMAAGLPVVASDVGGVAEAVVDGTTGLLVPSGDPSALADALQRLLRDAELRRSFGAAGRDRVLRRFDAASFRTAHLELYRRELMRRGLPTPLAEPSPAEQPLLSVAAEPGK
jgi:glycosyltransferase involved in cell wall biosynthesis